MSPRQRTLERVRAAVRRGAYDMTHHAVEEMAEDEDIYDVEYAILNGKLLRIQEDDPRGPRYTVIGTELDGTRAVGVLGRFTSTGRFLVITIYEVTE